MSERHSHTNPWAERLQQVTLPDSAAAWRSMEAILDREMPVGEKKDRRRWLLLILLLLLVIGICNCPGRGRWFRSSSTSTGSLVTPPVVAGKTTSSSTARGQNPAPAGSPAHPNRTAHQKRPTHPDASARRRPTSTNPSTRPSTQDGPDPVSQTDTSAQPGSQARAGRPAVSPDTLHKKPKPAPLKDSTHKTSPTPPKKEDRKDREKGFVAAIGLNQFFPLGSQQASAYNSGGLSGTFGDYIPVPMIRYYFNKRLYVQLEAQFNAPQYTKKDLVISMQPPDSLSPTRASRASVSIQKLFYFNLPLSVHYSPLENLSIGAGLQFSRLRNAIGSFDTTIITTGIVYGPDSLVGKRVTSLKGSSAYQRISTNEFRVLVDVNYTCKHFILGLRYNQALSKFINVQLGPGSVTQARNNSLQFYIRYILWDGRKKNPNRTESLTISVPPK